MEAVVAALTLVNAIVEGENWRLISAELADVPVTDADLKLKFRIIEREEEEVSPGTP
jgi:hypothetical protein